jgi:hypothetical protein
MVRNRKRHLSGARQSNAWPLNRAAPSFIGNSDGEILIRPHQARRLWQMNCFRESSGVKINVRTKIRYNGREYSSPNELPAGVREAYQKAACQTASLNQCLDKIVIHSQKPPGEADEARRLYYEDIMRVVENNGQVTLPIFSEPFPTKRQIKVLLLVLSALGLAALAVVARGFG